MESFQSFFRILTMTLTIEIVSKTFNNIGIKHSTQNIAAPTELSPKGLATLPSQYPGVASPSRKQYLECLSSVSVLLIAGLHDDLGDAVRNLYRIKIPGKRLLGLVIV